MQGCGCTRCEGRPGCCKLLRGVTPTQPVYISLARLQTCGGGCTPMRAAPTREWAVRCRGSPRQGRVQAMCCVSGVPAQLKAVAWKAEMLARQALCLLKRVSPAPALPCSVWNEKTSARAFNQVGQRWRLAQRAGHLALPAWWRPLLSGACAGGCVCIVCRAEFVPCNRPVARCRACA